MLRPGLGTADPLTVFFGLEPLGVISTNEKEMMVNNNSKHERR